MWHYSFAGAFFMENLDGTIIEWSAVAASLGVAIVSLSIAARHLQHARFPLMIGRCENPDVQGDGPRRFLFTAHTPLAVIVLVLLSSGVNRSIAFTAYNTIAFADIAAEDVGNANTLSATMPQLTMGLGVAVGALALRAGGPIARLFGASGTGASPFAAGFVIVAALAFVAVADSALLRPDAGAASSRGPMPASRVKPVPIRTYWVASRLRARDVSVTRLLA